MYNHGSAHIAVGVIFTMGKIISIFNMLYIRFLVVPCKQPKLESDNWVVKSQNVDLEAFI